MAAKYYAMIDGERKGPFSLEDLPAAGVRPSTYIWTKGMPDWQKAEENADVCRLFRNHLYDIMHPGQPSYTPEELERYKVSKDPEKPSNVSRFDRMLQEAGQDPLPTIEELEAKKDTTVPPVSMIGYAWLVTFFCCIPTGIVALVYAYKSRNAWNKGENAAAHELNRKAKMWTGISFCLGLIGYGLFLALSL